MKRRKIWVSLLSAVFAIAVCLSALPASAAETTYVENFDFTTMTDISELSRFSVGVDPATNDTEKGYTGDSWVTYERTMADAFTLDNGLKVNTDIYSGEDVSENNLYVRLNDKELQYYTAKLVYSFDDTRRGWAGFVFGMTNFARKVRWGNNPYGMEIFVQNTGKGTYAANKFNDGSYHGGDVPAVWTEAGEHTITVTVLQTGITLTADGTEVISITAAEMTAAGFTLQSAAMGFMLTNAAFTVKSFSYSPLNAQGEEYVAVEDLSVQAPATGTQFMPYTVQTTITPANATLPTVGYRLPAGASAAGNVLYFTRAGQYTITAYSIDNPTITDEFSVEIQTDTRYIEYAATEEGAQDLDLYYVTNGGSKDGTSYPVENYFSFDEDGMTRTEKRTSGTDSSYTLLYLKDPVNGLAVSENCFEIIYTVKSTLSTPNGWHGVGFALSDRATVPNQDGISAFIQEEATKATIWGSGKAHVGGPYEEDSSYRRGSWNLIRVRAFGSGANWTIQMFVNDMDTPAVERSAAALTANEIAIFTTTTVTFGNVYYAKLDSHGDAVSMVYPESVEIQNAPTTAVSGNSFQIEAVVTPTNVTIEGMLYTSSNPLVATVNASGLVTFLNAGQTTITASCKGDPTVQDSFTVTVTNPEVLPTSVAFDIIPTNAQVGGRYTLLVTVLPDNASDYSVTFASSNTDVATVDGQGRLVFVGAGDTVITVTCVADPTVSASFNLTVAGDSSGGGTTSSGCNKASAGVSALIALIGAGLIIGKKK